MKKKVETVIRRNSDFICATGVPTVPCTTDLTVCRCMCAIAANFHFNRWLVQTCKYLKTTSFRSQNTRTNQMKLHVDKTIERYYFD